MSEASIANRLGPAYANTSGISRASSIITFDGTAGAGAVGTPVPVFEVTGRVLIHLISGHCTTNLTEALATATIALGTTNQTTVFIGATNSVNIDVGEWWASTTPTIGALDSADAIQAVLVAEDIIITPGTQATNAGVLEFYCLWEPLSSGASVRAS